MLNDCLINLCLPVYLFISVFTSVVAEKLSGTCVLIQKPLNNPGYELRTTEAEKQKQTPAHPPFSFFFLFLGDSPLPFLSSPPTARFSTTPPCVSSLRQLFSTPSPSHPTLVLIEDNH